MELPAFYYNLHDIIIDVIRYQLKRIIINIQLTFDLLTKCC